MIYINTKSKNNFIDISDFSFGKNGMQYPVVSLFSGAGGLDIGLEESGFHTAVCVEYDADCRETLRYNRPEWRLFEEGVKIEKGKMKTRIPGDIRDIGIDELLKLAGLKKGEAALVVGGAPCQPFSNIGKKLGRNDEKNGDLFLEFVRIVKGVSPEAFIFENVVGITQQKHADVIKYMSDKFKGLGYGISHAVLNSANYGVPQRRERFFLIGIKGVENPSFPFPTHFKDEKILIFFRFVISKNVFL
jgi:DNA (cytosine-5)-methyltransferase 1